MCLDSGKISKVLKITTFNFLKKKISVKEMATGLYHATISNTIKSSLKDYDENIILTKKEQAILLVSHLFDLVEKKNLKKAKLYLITTFVANNYKIKDDDELTFQMAIALDTIEKVRDFIKNIPPESHNYFKQNYLFDKNLDPIQKTLVMHWYVTYCKAIDSVFESAIKKFKIIDEE